DWLTQAANGHDPLAAVRAAKLAAARSQQASFAAVAEAWFAAEVAQQRKGKRVIREMRRECFPAWGTRPITAITTLDVHTLVKAKQVHAPQQVRNLLGQIQRLFSWAGAQHIYGLTNNPAALLRPTKLFGRKQARDRVLADDELHAVWAAAEQIGYPYGDVLKLLILTGQRRSEVAEARWGEFDLTKRLWTIPAERMKTKAVHVVPLTKFVCKLLPTLPRFTGDCVFSTTFGVSPVTGFSQLREKLTSLLGDKVAPFVLHDLRRTVRTNLSALPLQDVV